MTQTITGYLLTRQWRDTTLGIELSFWISCENGPVNIVVTQQEAVCFVQNAEQFQLPAGARRQARQLKLLSGEPADALYFKHQRDLNTFRQSGVPLCESDVKPHDRYLMERFLCAGIQVQLTAEQAAAAPQPQRIYNPKLKPISYSPTLSALSIDIETNGHSDELYSIAGSLLGADKHGNCVFMIGQGPNEEREGYVLRYAENETALLCEFFEWLNQLDPDLITGWAVINFDLNFIDRKCKSLGIKMAMGRGGEAAAVLAPMNPGQPRIARVPGRAVLDGIDLLKAGFWTFDSFSLDNVSHELLGERKLISGNKNKVAEINALFKQNKPALADYNIKDCQLVNDIFVKAELIAFAQQRANLTGLAIDRLGGSVAAFDNLYLPRLHRQGFVAPDINSESDGLGSPGGYVLDSIPGIFKNVLVLDFKSLYPSIIRTFFIDPLGLSQPGNNPIDGFMDATFSRSQHILPGLIEELSQARDGAKKDRNRALSQAIKIIMNSFYGVLGSSGCRFHSHQLASSITRRGHEIITRSKDLIEQQGYQVIYGDTDSLFVLIGDNHDTNSALKIGKRLTVDMNRWWEKTLRDEYQLESKLEVEFELHFMRFLMPTVRGMPTGSKKRYAGLVQGKNNEPELIVKGLEAARTDWTPLARNFQKELFQRVFTDQPFEQFVRHTADALLNGESDELLIYRKRLRRKLSDYQRNVPPHVQAARKSKKQERWVSYIITRNGPEPLDNLTSAPDYTHYMEKQLAPAADGILQFLGTDFRKITDAQLQMF